MRPRRARRRAAFGRPIPAGDPPHRVVAFRTGCRAGFPDPELEISSDQHHAQGVSGRHRLGSKGAGARPAVAAASSRKVALASAAACRQRPARSPSSTKPEAARPAARRRGSLRQRRFMEAIGEAEAGAPLLKSPGVIASCATRRSAGGWAESPTSKGGIEQRGRVPQQVARNGRGSDLQEGLRRQPRPSGGTDDGMRRRRPTWGGDSPSSDAGARSGGHIFRSPV